MPNTSESARASTGRSGVVKKPYVKPTVTLVPLRPEEAVLAGCKMPPGGTAFVTCGLSGCIDMGS